MFRKLTGDLVDLFRTQGAADAVVGHLDQRCLRGHGDDLFDGRELENVIDGDRRTRFYDQSRLNDGLEPLHHDVDVIGSGPQVDHEVRAVPLGDGRAGIARRQLDESDGHSRHRQSIGIDDPAVELTVLGLAQSGSG